jgi:hypothetical protein
MALVLGCLLSLFAVVIATILDRSIRFPGDVKERLDQRVLAVVPKARVTATIRKKLEVVGDESRTVALSPSDGNGFAPAAAASDTAASVSALDGDGAAPSADGNGHSGAGPRSLRGPRLKRVN